MDHGWIIPNFPTALFQFLVWQIEHFYLQVVEKTALNWLDANVPMRLGYNLHNVRLNANNIDLSKLAYITGNFLQIDVSNPV